MFNLYKFTLAVFTVLLHDFGCHHLERYYVVYGKSEVLAEAFQICSIINVPNQCIVPTILTCNLCSSNGLGGSSTIQATEFC